MAIRSVALKTLLLICLAASPALSPIAFAKGGKGDGPNGGRDSGGGNGNNPDNCQNGRCPLIAEEKIEAKDAALAVEFRDEEVPADEAR